MNALFKQPEIPEFIPLATLVHEMTHYAHGFNSPLERKYDQPHAGGVIRREYAERGLEELYVRQRRWLKLNWPRIIAENFDPPKPRRRTTRRGLPKVTLRKPFWM